MDEALREMERVLKPGGFLFLDGLNSLFWLHVFRNWQQYLNGSEKRMKYYNPFRLVERFEQMGFRDARVHWLAMPERSQALFGTGSHLRFALLPRLFGYSFLITARKNVADGTRKMC